MKNIFVAKRGRHSCHTFWLCASISRENSIVDKYFKK